MIESIQNIFPDSFIYASGMMILHLLWQAVVLASLLTVLLVMFRRSSPQTRYNAALTALFIIPVAASITFYSEFNHHQYLTKVYQATGTTPTSGSSDFGIQTLISFYSQYLPIIVMVWIFGIMTLLLKSLGQLILIQRLKNHYLQPLSTQLDDLLTKVKSELNITRNFSAFFSSKALTPMVIGHLKPVILFPENIIESLQENELIAVIRHELAHIKRNDYAMNLIQSFIEIVFFFHPVTWWISAIVRKEREECCDTYAFENDQSKLALANALTKLVATYENNYAVTLINNKQSLIKRIKAMFKNQSSMTSFKEGIIVAVFVVISIASMSFLTKSPDDSKSKSRTVTKAISGQSVDGEYLFAKVNATGDVMELYVDGKKIGKKKYTTYQVSLDSLQTSMTNTNTRADLLQELRAKEMETEQRKEMELAQKKLELARKEMEKAREEMVSTQRERELAQRERELAQNELDLAKREIKTLKQVSVDAKIEAALKTAMKATENIVMLDIMRSAGEKMGFNMEISEPDKEVNLNFENHAKISRLTDTGDGIIEMSADANGFKLVIDEEEVVNVNLKVPKGE